MSDGAEKAFEEWLSGPSISASAPYLEKRRTFMAGRNSLVEKNKELRDALHVVIGFCESWHEHNKAEFMDVDWFEEEKRTIKDLAEKFKLSTKDTP